MTSSQVLGSSWCRRVFRPRTPALPTKASSPPGGDRALRQASMAAKSRRSMGTRRRFSLVGPERRFRRRVPRGRPGCGRERGMRARLGQGEGHGAANAARGPRHQRDTGRPVRFDSLNRHSLRHFLGLPMGTIAEERGDGGRGRVAIGGRDVTTWIFFPQIIGSTPRGLPGRKSSPMRIVRRGRCALGACAERTPRGGGKLIGARNGER